MKTNVPGLAPYGKCCPTNKPNVLKLLTVIMILLAFHQKCCATAWTTSAAGPITALSSWTNGSTSPSSFSTPGDTWIVTRNMTITSTSSWVLGTASSAPDSVRFNSGGSLTISGTGIVASITIYGHVYFNGGRMLVYGSGGSGATGNIVINGDYFMNAGNVGTAGTNPRLIVSTYGNYTMSGDTVDASGSGGTLRMNIHGNYKMGTGLAVCSGSSTNMLFYVYGNYNSYGTSRMTSLSSTNVSEVHLALPASTATMLVRNTSTGSWSGTDVYIDSFATAQLDSNFSTATGGSSNGLFINGTGTLICPAAYTVNGNRAFTMIGSSNLVVASPSGVNGAIVTSGTVTLDPNARFEFNGTSAQVTGSMMPASFYGSVTINDTAGVTLSQSTSILGTLKFVNGKLNTGAYTMSVQGIASCVTGASATSYVNGTLIKTIAYQTTLNFEVGDTNYAPLAMSLSSAGTSGSLGVKVFSGLHPNVSTSGLNTSNMASHYWKITNASAAGPFNVTPKATYNASDIIGGSNSSFVTQQYSGSAWLGAALSTTNTASPYTSMPTTIALSALAGEYIFGNAGCSTAAITGASSVCAGATITLACATAGGTWSSGASSIASVSTTGVVSGLAPGTAIITYTASGCPATKTITVNPLPVVGPITGVSSICIGLTTALADTTAGGSWSSSATGVATVSSTGVVTGVTAGSAIIIYSVTNSCGTASTTLSITVSSTLTVASIAGADSVCQGNTTNLTDPTSGGVWSSSATGVATISSTGVVTGVSAGTAIIIYSVTSGCGTASATHNITVNAPLTVAPIVGIDSLCEGGTLTLTNTTAGGNWTTSNAAIATVNSSGIVTGLAPGYDTVIYTLTNSCGSVSSKLLIKVKSFADCNVGIKSLTTAVEGALVAVFPNPTNGLFTVSSSSGHTAPIHVVITNVLGVTIKELNIDQEANIRLDQPSGIYMLKATDNTGRSSASIIVIR